jgi:hypothetical protein
MSQEIALVAEVADVALQGLYPGIEIRRGIGGHGWVVRLPNADGSFAQASDVRLQAAVDACVQMQVKP